MDDGPSYADIVSRGAIREFPSPIKARVELELRPPTLADRKAILLELRCTGERKQFPDPYAGAIDTRPNSAVLIRLTEVEAFDLGMRLLEAVGKQPLAVPPEAFAMIEAGQEFGLLEFRDWQRASAEAGRRASISPENFEQAEPGRGE
jgi:hypothetical protein